MNIIKYYQLIRLAADPDIVVVKLKLMGVYFVAMTFVSLCALLPSILMQSFGSLARPQIMSSVLFIFLGPIAQIFVAYLLLKRTDACLAFLNVEEAE